MLFIIVGVSMCMGNNYWIYFFYFVLNYSDVYFRLDLLFLYMNLNDKNGKWISLINIEDLIVSWNVFVCIDVL